MSAAVSAFWGPEQDCVVEGPCLNWETPTEPIDVISVLPRAGGRRPAPDGAAPDTVCGLLTEEGPGSR